MPSIPLPNTQLRTLVNKKVRSKIRTMALSSWLFLAIFMALFMAGQVICLVGSQPAQAGWLSKLMGQTSDATKDASGGARKMALRGTDPLVAVAAYIKTLKTPSAPHALAVQATQEGHWRFANRSGETYTAGTKAELQRALKILLPDELSAPSNSKGKGTGTGTGTGPKSGHHKRKIALYLTPDSVFKHRSQLVTLPQADELHVVLANNSYRLRLERASKRQRKPAVAYAQLRSGLVAKMVSRPEFTELIWQLERSLNRADIRILSLLDGAERKLSATPRLDETGKRPLIDEIEPSAVLAALPALRGQTVVISGRIKRGFLYFKPRREPNSGVPLAGLHKAAENADLNLIMLDTHKARQPGARNWLWLKASVQGLGQALDAATFADFLNALAGSRGAMEVKLARSSAGRITITTLALTNSSLLPNSGGISNAWSNMMSKMAGQLAHQGLTAALRSSERQAELDRRIVPRIPSLVQYLYIGLMALGLVALSVARSWWQKIWPSERRSDYRNGFGYGAATAVRGIMFALVFLPISAVFAVVVQFANQLWYILMAPVRAYRWLHRDVSPN